MNASSKTSAMTAAEVARRRYALAPATEDAFSAFSRTVFRDGALSSKQKQLVAIAVAHVTQCHDCIKGHTRAAIRAGATAEEIAEAIWVAAEMRAGATFAHASIAVRELAELVPLERGNTSEREG